MNRVKSKVFLNNRIRIESARGSNKDVFLVDSWG